MHDAAFQELEIISQAVGNFPDMVQGGGGNTSVKLNDELMAVKASGYKLKQVTRSEGFVLVNYKDIKDYFARADLNSDIDYEKDSTAFLKKSVVKVEGLRDLRPSVEAGFHSILLKYVIHSHSVYANILCCSKKGEEIIRKVFSGKHYNILWVPYVNPGFYLTLKIQEGIKCHIEKGGKFPKVIFMENHGLIVNSDSREEVIKLHEEVNESIKTFLHINSPYPEITLERVNDNTYLSRTTFLTDFFKNNLISPDYFDVVALYPDQLVYLNDNISVDGMDNKLNINTKTGEIIYKSSFSEAMTMEETLLGYVYVVSKIKQCNLPIKTMTPEEIGFIKNWESEKYRKTLIK
ncbi:class II aldolase [Biomaibacter acetigenes]|uniref:Class II aldolase n=1 Tax=Biomaibacter acetigenes TaxID=2316383 RepID=A0A3G2R3V5_9FIRM|nr:class II aldolase/adducin family protein [Biomaibacter acetigenes]AYO30140.1 class II aldolase [Biomaibacter acetigenes]